MPVEQQMPVDGNVSDASRHPRQQSAQEQGTANIQRLNDEESKLSERLARLEGKDCRDLAGGIWLEQRHVIDVFAARLKASPQAVAVEYWSSLGAAKPATRLRYWELAWLVERLARQLMELPTFVPPETRPTSTQNACGADSNGLRGQQAVLIHAPRDAKVIVAMLAALYCGAVVIVLEEGRADAHVTGIVEEANVFALLHDADKPPPPLQPHCTPLNLPSCSIPFWARFRSASFRPQPSTDSSIACIIYTSGSSGKPKGAMLRQDSIANYSCIEQAVGNMRPTDRVVQLQSLSFVSGYMETFRALLSGATLVMGGPEISRSGPDLWGWMEEHGITVMKAVPTLCAGLLAGHSTENPPRVPKCFRLLHLSGEKLEQGMVNNLYAAVDASDAQTVIIVTYGSTEMSANCSARICKPNDVGVSIGRALPSYFVGLLPETPRSACAPPSCLPTTSDASGEIVVGGIGVTVGYLNNEDATNKAFVEVQGHGKIYRTGDKGAWGPNGEIVFLGRVGGSTQVKIAGYRIELGEVEHALLQLPYVKAAGALVDDSQKLVVVLESRVSVLTQQVRADLKQGGKLPAHGIPSVVHVVDELPTTVSGKLDRRRLQAIATELEELSANYLNDVGPPPAEPELTLRSGMAIVLGLAKETDTNAWARIPKGDSHFFNDLGGSSVTAGQLIGWFRQHGKVKYAMHASTRLLFQHPTARDLAAVIESKCSQEPLQRRPRQTDASSQPAHKRTSSERCVQRIFACFQIVYVLFLTLLESLEKIAIFRLVGVGQYAYQRIADYGQGHTVVVIVLSLLLLPVIKKAAATVIGFLWRSLAMTLKWLLIGRYRVGKYPKYGSFHVRHWLVTATLKASASAANERSFIGATAGFKELWYRVLGMKMGRGVTIDHSEGEVVRFDLVPDLVSLGSGCVLHESHVVNVKETATEIELVEVSLGANSVLKPGSVVIGPATVGDNAELGYNSSLIASDIPANEVRYGNPARAQGRKVTPAKTQPLPWWSWPCVSATLIGFILDYLLTAVLYGVRLSASVLLWSFNPPTTESDRLLRYVIIFAVRSIWYPLVDGVLCALLCRSMCLRGACKQAKDDAHSLFSALWMRVLIAQRAYKSCLHTLNNTQFVAAFLRSCGASVGSGVSIARTMGTIPQLVTIGKNVFFGNEVYLGMPTLEAGAQFRLRPVEIGDDGLVGNLAVIPPGCSLPPKSVIAVSTVPDCGLVHAGDIESPAVTPTTESTVPDRGPALEGDIEQPVEKQAPVCCIGCPAVDLPVGHMQADRPRPTRWQRSRRFVVDLLCAITIPTTESLSFLSTLVALLFLHSFTGVSTLVDIDATAPFTTEGLLIGAGLILFFRKVVGANLALLTLLARGGRLRAGEWDFWSPFVDRWHLNIKLGVAVNQLLLAPFRKAGIDAFTRIFSLVNPFFDCAPDATMAGCRLKEADVTSIGPRSVIGHGVTLRTHTFEGWRLKIGPVRVGADVVVGENAHILPGAVLEDGCTVLPNTIVSNNETVPAGVTFGGSPGEIMMCLDALKV